MEDADIGRGRHRRQGKPRLIRIHGGVNLSGLVLFGGALAVGGLVATFIFKKSRATDDDKKSTSLTGDKREQKQQPMSNETLEGNQAEPAATKKITENCQGMLVAHETQEEIDVTPVHHDGDATGASSSEESLSPEDVDVMELDGGAETTKLNADEEIQAGDDDEHDDEKDLDNRENRGKNASPDIRCSADIGRDKESNDISNGDSREDLEEEVVEEEEEEEEGEEGEAFNPEVTEMEDLEENDKGSLARETMRMPPTQLKPKEDASSEELRSIKDDNNGEGEEATEEGTVGVVMNTQKTEYGVIEEVDGYVEDDDVDDMASEEDDSRGSSDDDMEKDELEKLEGTETCSTTDSNAEAIIWPAETIESLAMALEDQLTHLKKTATEGINNNSSRESEIMEEEDEHNYDASESSMLLEKPMMMVNGQIAELISRRIWIFPMLMLLLVMVLFLLTRRNPLLYYCQSNAI